MSKAKSPRLLFIERVATDVLGGLIKHRQVVGLEPHLMRDAVLDAMDGWHVRLDRDHVRDAEGRIHDGTDVRSEIVEPAVDLVAFNVTTDYRPVESSTGEIPTGEISTEAPIRQLANPSDTESDSRPRGTLNMLGQTKWWRGEDGWVRRRDMSVARKAHLVGWLERHVGQLLDRAILDLERVLQTAPDDPSDGVADVFAEFDGELNQLLANRRASAATQLTWLRGQPLYRRLVRDIARGRGVPEAVAS